MANTFNWDPDNVGATTHFIGDRNCGGCWTHTELCDCGGVIHNQFGDENYDGDFWLYRKCDRCELKK